MTNTAAIQNLIAQARRRAVWQILLEHFGWGLVAGLSALLILLLVGTQILNWYWPLLLVAITVAIGWGRSRNRLPGAYEVACRVDRQLGLHDLISTAHHFADPGKANPEYVEALRAEAESTAASVDPAMAVPLRAPRNTWPAIALLVASLVMFFVRYGVLHTFDLRAPIAEVRFDTLTGVPAPVRSAPKELAQKGLPPEPFSLTLPESERVEVTERNSMTEESLRTVDVKDPDKATSQGQKGDKQSAGQNNEDEGSDEGENASGDKNQSPSGAQDSRKPGDPNAAQPKQGQKPKDSSLMDKMRDAMANLMDKLKMENKGESQQSAANKGNQKSQGQQKGEKGQPQQGKSNQPGEPDASQPGEQPGDAENAQQAKSNQAGSNQDVPNNQEKSGIGKQDGKKDTELAEQKEAMGKLSELLGKRALNLQGEVMVEVTNSKNQQLKTPYVNRSGNHIEAGGDLSRDEVPLHLQDFVQRYYEKVRKPAPPSAHQ
ncbi:hypothetical protein [uncultured Paludibaculum sp.]|uniref:hypothetical protein n=1 Tax=uncultured Paludibaculum sp. TaxID=1765020 RepID=UPI002AABA5DD|nr:hypothetical protein [uncultured Paludibaculum sp.]